MFTVTDEALSRLMERVDAPTGMRLEPSAVAGLARPGWIEGSATGQEHLARLGDGGRPT